MKIGGTNRSPFVYKDRAEAGELLANALIKYRGQDGVVFAVPRGGVPVAFIVAHSLKMPLDLLLSKKIGHPSNKEYAIGAASLTDYYIAPDTGVNAEYINTELNQIRARLKEMRTAFDGNVTESAISGKTVIIVDDGVATGNTLLATVKMLRRQKPAKLVIAVPVSSMQAYEKLVPLVDEMVCPLIPEEFWGVGAFYGDFAQVSDEEVMHYLQMARKDAPSPAS